MRNGKRNSITFSAALLSSVSALTVGSVVFAQSDTAQAVQSDDQIVVTGVRTFRDDLDSDVTGFELSVKDTPQSITIASRELLEATASFSVIDAADYIAGLSVVEPSGGIDTDFRARGFLISQGNGFRQNGFSVNHDFFPDTAVLERVEFIKGVNSIRYGENNPGGFLNYVFKKPEAESASEFALFAGSNSFVRFEGDMTGPLNASGSVRGRLIAAYEKEDTYIDFGDSTVVVVAPSLAIDISDTITQEFFGYYQDFSTVPEAGVSIDNNGNIPDIDTSLFTGQPWARVENQNISIQSITTWEPREDVTVRVGGYFSENDSFRHYARPRNGIFVEDTLIFKPTDAVEETVFTDGLGREYIDVPAGTVAGYDIRRQANSLSQQYGVQVTGNYEFSFLGQDHIISAFLEYEEGEAGTGSSASGSRTSTKTFNIFDPDYTIPFNQNTFEPDDTAEAENLGLSLQALLRPLPRVAILAGVRYDDGEQRTIAPDGSTAVRNGVELNQKTEETTYSVGGTFEVTDNINLYATWGESFTPNAFASDFEDNLLPPETGELFEVGAKGEFFDGNLLATIAWYDIERKNVALEDNTNDPERNLGIFGTGALRAAGTQESTGVEVEMVGKITDNWRVSAGYAYTDANIVEDDDPNIVDNGRPNIPENAFNMFTNYKFSEGSLAGLQVGVGLRYRGERPSDTAKQRRFFNGFERDPMDPSQPLIVGVSPIPNFVTVDTPTLDADTVVTAQATYDVNDNITVGLNVQNLFEEESFDSGFSAASTGVRPIPPREIIFSIRGRM